MCWLLKSEPEVRIEDGYEIKFSIDDLAAKTKPEGWDGGLPPNTLLPVIQLTSHVKVSAHMQPGRTCAQ